MKNNQSVQILNDHEVSLNCPNCRSPRVLALGYARKIGGTVGTVGLVAGAWNSWRAKPPTWPRRNCSMLCRHLPVSHMPPRPRFPSNCRTCSTRINIMTFQSLQARMQRHRVWKGCANGLASVLSINWMRPSSTSGRRTALPANWVPDVIPIVRLPCPLPMV